eukprot:62799-Prymnesium_polylepis.1
MQIDAEWGRAARAALTNAHTARSEEQLQETAFLAHRRRRRRSVITLPPADMSVGPFVFGECAMVAAVQLGACCVFAVVAALLLTAT